MTSENNKRIAKNTGMLYFRMLITMAVSLYTSRIVLNTLGVEDYGIYSAVAGFVTMFGVLNSAMASASQRFLAFEIGRNEKNQLRNVFSMSVNFHFLIAFLILILSETVGLWFLNTQLTIPPERMSAARWVYQFSILTLMVNMISVPYNAMIIAHERMNVFAWVSIAEVSLKLFIVFMLQWLGFDKLKLYAILLFIVALLIRLIYGVYCNIKFKESKFRFYWDKPLFKTLVSYAGWSLWGSSAGIIIGQGINVLLNIFFGPVVNAAYGIAFRIKSVVNQFVHNFQMALNPPIIKSYAADDLEYMHQLIFRGAKYSYFLLFTLTLPILLETEIILKLWLKIVPEYTVILTRLILINILIESISRPLMTAAQASGKIKLYQGVVGGLLILNLPVSYLFLKLGFPPESTLWIGIVISVIALIARLMIIKKLVKLKVHNFIKQVIIRCLVVSIIALLIPIIIYLNLENNIMRFFILIFSSVIISIINIYIFGLDSHEKVFFKKQTLKIINKLKLNKK